MTSLCGAGALARENSACLVCNPDKIGKGNQL
jgi:hypothetical protein